jgi:hypothetical protein
MTEEQQVDFECLNMKYSDTIKTYSIEKQREIFEYLSRLDEHNRKAYDIAYCHLGTSFNIARSNGFKAWLASKKQT